MPAPPCGTRPGSLRPEPAAHTNQGPATDRLARRVADHLALSSRRDAAVAVEPRVPATPASPAMLHARHLLYPADAGRDQVATRRAMAVLESAWQRRRDKETPAHPQRMA